MRKTPLYEVLSQKGVSFAERYGVSIPFAVADTKSEYSNIRNAVGITDFSFMQKFRINADEGIDFLDSIFPGNVAKIRFCRLLHTFLADEQGELMADCYIANNDEDFIILCESIVSDQVLKDLFDKHGAQEAGLKDITNEQAIISIDGYKAWAVVKEIFGSDVLGLPYLSIETYPFEGKNISFFRAGKTSEFGYLIMADKDIAPLLMERLLEESEKHQGGLCGLAIHNDLRLEGRFFNIFSEGQRVKDPLPLGLQWMIDFDKESFVGRMPIIQAREKGLKQKIIGIQTSPSVGQLAAGDQIYNGKGPVTQVSASAFSQVLNSWVGLALFPVDIACVGLEFSLGSPEGEKIQTISMPPIIPKSLSVKLDEM